jgi:hypothetical protein
MSLENSNLKNQEAFAEFSGLPREGGDLTDRVEQLVLSEKLAREGAQTEVIKAIENIFEVNTVGPSLLKANILGHNISIEAKFKQSNDANADKDVNFQTHYLVDATTGSRPSTSERVKFNATIDGIQLSDDDAGRIIDKYWNAAFNMAIGSGMAYQEIASRTRAEALKAIL